MSDKDTPESSSPSDSTALGLALGRASASVDEEAIAFLRDQRRMLHMQIEEMTAETPLKLSHLRIRRFGDYAKMGFEISIGLLVLALVAGISLMVWNAAHSDGLIVESFSVPPGLATRGITGQVIATQVLDKLTVMQNDTSSSRPKKSYASNWGDDLKVEIPDTGMSVGELYRFLRGWLGHETHISGEVTSSASGISITARAGGNPGATFTGAEADLDKIVQQAAEHVYRSTQPYRYGVFLFTHGRRDEAVAMFKAGTEKGSAQDRSWSYGGLVSTDPLNLRFAERRSLLQQAVALAPDNFVALNNLGNVYNQAGRTEEAYRIRKQLLAMQHDRTSQSLVDAQVGAWREAAALLEQLRSENATGGFTNLSGGMATYETNAHDMDNARRHASTGFRDFANGNLPDQSTIQRALLKMTLATAAENWAEVVAEAEAVATLRVKYPGLRERDPILFSPPVAYAKARLGDIAGAEKLIAAAPGNCYPCLSMRGRIAQLAKAYDRSDFWFTRAAAAGPSLPFAEFEWGRALLERGHPDDAIEKFKLSNAKGPHFADPLEYWGEALMAKNQSHLALKKFTEAEKYAPNWGRLHLKWGEALIYAGKPAEAKAQFARARQLDLTPSEKQELSRLHV